MKRQFLKDKKTWLRCDKYHYATAVKVWGGCEIFYESDTNGTVCVIQIPDDGKENCEQ